MALQEALVQASLLTVKPPRPTKAKVMEAKPLTDYNLNAWNVK